MRRLIHAPLSLGKLLTALLVVAFFIVLLQLAVFNFLQSLFWIVRERRDPDMLASGLFILRHAWPLSAVVVLLSAALALILRAPLGDGVRQAAIWGFYAAMSLVGVAASILFFTALLGNDNHAATLWNPSTFDQWSLLVRTPWVLFGLVVFLAAGVIVLRAFWEWAVPAFLETFYHVRLAEAPAKGSKNAVSGDDFLEQYKNLIAQAARDHRPLGLMGIRIANDLELIQKHGKENYGRVMEELQRFARQIARRGEFQLLYRGHVVLSVLLADEHEATLGARRFDQTLGPMLAQRFPDFGLHLAVGVSGYRFAAPVRDEAELARLAETLFWDATDQASRAVESAAIPVVYRKVE